MEPYAGTWVQGEGEYTEKDGAIRRVAVSIGPEHGTVGPELVKKAAKEAVNGVGYDLLIVCGFAFDPHAGMWDVLHIYIFCLRSWFDYDSCLTCQDSHD